LNAAAAAVDGPHLLLAAVLALLVAGAARAARALSPSGALAAAFVGFCVFGFAGGWGAAALLLFFGTSSALSRWRKREKERLAFEKGGERDAGQVLANGGVAACCAVLSAAFPGAGWPLAALLGALAAANADTWATEIGALSRRPPRMVTTLRPAPPGASGAVSPQGSLASLAGALLIGLVAAAPGLLLGPPGVLAATAGGVLGSVLDSLLGATLQAQYRCPRCGRLTERRVHCADATPMPRARGIGGFGNDAVNAAATLAGAASAALLFGALGG
jgi:uncharacterized protein (TIGR00297 family)